MMSLFSSSLVFAQTEACSFSDDEIEGVEVGQIGDRQIYTLFTPHLFYEPGIFSLITNYNRLEGTVTALNQLIEWYQERIESEQSEAQKITRLVESGNIDWISIEYSKTGTSYISNTTSYLQTRDKINTTLNHFPE